MQETIKNINIDLLIHIWVIRLTENHTATTILNKNEYLITIFPHICS